MADHKDQKRQRLRDAQSLPLLVSISLLHNGSAVLLCEWEGWRSRLSHGGQDDSREPGRVVALETIVPD